MNLYSPVISGSLTVTGSTSFIGNVTMTGTVSATASNAALLDGTGSVGFTTTGSFTTMSGSVSSRVSQIESVYATTGSNSFRATQSITGSLTVTGQIIAQTLNVQQVTSSIVFSSGSNSFGCDLNSRQTFTGSVLMTGSLVVNTTGPELQVNNNGVILGNLLTDNHSITGSLRITGSSVTLAGSLTGSSAMFTSFNQASNFISDGNQFFSYTLKGRASDNYGAFGFYSNNGATRVGYIQSGTVCGGQINITGDGGGSINLDNRGIIATGAASFSSTLTTGGTLNVNQGDVKLFTYQNASGEYKFIGTEYAPGNGNNRAEIRFGIDGSDTRTKISFHVANGGGTINEALSIGATRAATFSNSITTPSLYGSSYAQTSTSGTTSFVNTGIFYNTSITGFGNNSVYNLVISGNPNGAGSSEYRAVYVGYVFVTTGFDFGISSVVQRINYTQVVTGDAFNIGTLTISAVFWNGTTETTQQLTGTTNNQIRLKITGYNSGNIGAAQVVTLTKVN